MKKSSCLKLFLCLISLIAFFYLILTPPISQADEIEDLQKQINELNKAQQQSIAATKPLEGQLTSLKRQLTQIQNNLKSLSDSITQKEKDLSDREKKLDDQQTLLNQRVRSYYIRSFLNSPILVIFSSQDATNLFRDLAYRLSASREDQRVIKQVTGEIIDLKDQKAKLEKDKNSLAGMKVQVDKNASYIDGEIKKNKAYQADLANKIASLTAKQKELIAQKLASLNLPTTAMTAAYSCNDSDKNPGFSPRFAVFSFGVNNHVGLNQYGAKGRAEAGQTYDQILAAYYANYNLVKLPTVNITVNGYSPEYNQTFNNEVYNLEDYVKRLYEMPSSWHPEALKAQVIAARSYALATSNNGAKTVCPSQSCQVIKHELNAAAWQKAVDDTAGLVMVSADTGSPITAWFSAVHGGYVYKTSDIGWSSTPWTKNAIDGTATPAKITDLFNTSYDRASSWFYCDWGSRSQYNNTAWLKAEEYADIVNVAVLAKLSQADGTSASVTSHLSQLDKPNPDGVDTWSPDRVKQEIKNRGGTPYNSVTTSTVNFDPNLGKTTSVYVSGDGGTQTIDAATFKSYFNLRSPANLQIVSLLFNVETR